MGPKGLPLSRGKGEIEWTVRGSDVVPLTGLQKLGRMWEQLEFSVWRGDGCKQKSMGHPQQEGRNIRTCVVT